MQYTVIKLINLSTKAYIKLMLINITK